MVAIFGAMDTNSDVPENPTGDAPLNYASVLNLSRNYQVSEDARSNNLH